MRKILLLSTLLCLSIFVGGCSFLNPFNWFGSDEPPREKKKEKVESAISTIDIKEKSKRMKVVPDALAANKLETLGTKYELYTIPVRVDSGDAFSWGGKFGIRSFRKKVFLLIDKKETLLYTFKENQEKIWVIFNIPMERIFILDKKTNALELYNLKGEKTSWTKTEKITSYHYGGGVFIVSDKDAILVYDPNRKAWLTTTP